LLADTRHSCPSRHSRKSQNATSTILNQRSGGILGTYSINKKWLPPEEPRNRDLELFSSKKLFNELVKKLKLVLCYVHDGSTMGGVTVRMGSPENAPAEDQEDEWHLRKYVLRSWRLLLADKKLTTLKLIPFEEIWRHITFAHKFGLGDPFVVQNMILNAIKYYQDIHSSCISGKCREASYHVKHLLEGYDLKEFVKFIKIWCCFKQQGKVLRHCWGKSNNLSESIHNIMVKYCSKRLHYEHDAYVIRMDFANLDYSENLKNKYLKDRTYYWAQRLKAMYIEKCK